jgi:hypothetical protein
MTCAEQYWQRACRFDGTVNSCIDTNNHICSFLERWMHGRSKVRLYTEVRDVENFKVHHCVIGSESISTWCIVLASSSGNNRTEGKGLKLPFKYNIYL